MISAKQSTGTCAQQLLAVLLILWWGGLNCVLVCAAHLNELNEKDCAATQPDHACCANIRFGHLLALSKAETSIPLAVECCDTGVAAALVPKVRHLNKEFVVSSLQPNGRITVTVTLLPACVASTRSRSPNLQYTYLSVCILLI